jgi:putative SOS response-associated peptidase YedK
LVSFTILMTAANDLLRRIHNRMPIIALAEAHNAWLDPGGTDPVLVRELAGEFLANRMEAYRVERAVGNPRSQGPALVEPSTDRCLMGCCRGRPETGLNLPL